MIALAAALVILLAMALVLSRLFAGPTMHDRVLAAHAFALLVALLAAALAAAAREAVWLDFSIVVVLVDLLTVAVSLKFLRYRTMQNPLDRFPKSVTRFSDEIRSIPKARPDSRVLIGSIKTGSGLAQLEADLAASDSSAQASRMRR
jgi:multicomponent Na+:H+ antiporter subunit F